MLAQHVCFETLYTVLRMEEEKSLVHHKVGYPSRSTRSSFLSSIAIPSGCTDILVWKSIFFIGVHLFFLPVSIVHLFWKSNTWLCIVSKSFCDTFSGVSTGVTHCGSFIGGGFGLLVARYE
jgi:hypothetical protein